MSRYYLPTHVHFCHTDDATIFLDLKRDRYFGIEKTSVEALHAALEDAAQDQHRIELRSLLLKADLLTADTHHARSLNSPTIAHATRSLVDPDRTGVDAPQSGARWHHGYNIVRSFALANIMLKAGSLAAVIRRARRRIEQTKRSDQIDLDEIRIHVRAFLWLRPFLYVARSHCLLDSLTLLEFLACYGQSATWVLGVKTRTFAAHAWVQRDGFVLNDTPEYIREFAPILCV